MTSPENRPAQSCADQDRGRLLQDRLTRLARVTSALVMANSVEAVSKTVVTHGADAVGAPLAVLTLLSDDGRSVRMVGLSGGRPGDAEAWANYPVTDQHTHHRRHPDRRTPHPHRSAGDRRSVPGPGPGRSGEQVHRCAAAEQRHPLPWRCGSVVPRERELRLRRAGLLRIHGGHLRAGARPGRRRSRGGRTRPRSWRSWPTPPTSWPAAWTTRRRCQRRAAGRALFADWCAIALGIDGELRTPGGRARRPGQGGAGAGVRASATRPDPDAPRGSYQVFRTGRSELTPEITDEMLDAPVPRRRSTLDWSARAQPAQRDGGAAEGAATGCSG